MEILSENGIKFDKTFFLGREGGKAEVAIELIRQHDADSITIFEDSLWEIIKYTAWFLDAGLTIQIGFVFIDKSKVIKIDWDTAKSLEEFSEAERLKIV
jgi:hypothetical protein